LIATEHLQDTDKWAQVAASLDSDFVIRKIEQMVEDQDYQTGGFGMSFAGSPRDQQPQQQQ
jgi:hypothetical protein